MKRACVWFLLTLRSSVRRWTVWMAAVFSIVILWMTAAVSLPDSSSWRVLLWSEDNGARAQSLVADLESGQSSYRFERAESRESLIRQVETGEAQCGFILNEGFSEKMTGGDRNGIITYVSSSFTTKGAGAKETVFASLYSSMAGDLLKEQSAAIYGSKDPALLEGLDQWYRYYLESDEVFRISYHSIAPRGGVTSAVTNAAARGRKPVLSMALILLFFQFFLSEAGKGGNGALPGPACGLPSGQRIMWEFCSNLGEVFLPAVLMAAAVLRLDGNAGSPWRIAACTALTAVLSDFWVIGFRRLVRTHISYLCWSFTILTAEMILCPVFWNPGAYFPFLSIAGCLFPPGLVLMAV